MLGTGGFRNLETMGAAASASGAELATVAMRRVDPTARGSILDTLGAPGLVQSDQMRTEERFIPNGNRLTIVVTHHDPVNYSRPLVVTFTYQKLPGGEILPWDCTPDKANYDKFPPKPN